MPETKCTCGRDAPSYPAGTRIICECGRVFDSTDVDLRTLVARLDTIERRQVKVSTVAMILDGTVYALDREFNVCNRRELVKVTVLVDASDPEARQRLHDAVTSCTKGVRIVLP